MGFGGIFRGAVIVMAVALVACGSRAPGDVASSAPRRALPGTATPFFGETPFGFALAADTLAHDDVDACKELISGRAGWVSIAVTTAADGFVFALDRTPTASEVVAVQEAVRDCDLGLSFSLPATEQSDDYESVDVEPVEEWVPLQSGDTEGVHWTIYRARANPNLDGSPNTCYTVEVGPSSGPVIPTTTITYPGDRSLRGLTMSCQSDIGPKPKRRAPVALLGSVRLWQPMQMLGEDTSNESYVWIAGLVAPEVDHVRVEGVDVPVVEHTFLWLSRDGDVRPKQVELPGLEMTCDLEYDQSYGGSILPDCPLIPEK